MGRPAISAREWEPIAGFLGITVDQFVETYLGRTIRNPDEVRKLWAEMRAGDKISEMYNPEEPPRGCWSTTSERGHALSC
jgi:hypothetical protein